ncbi:MAG: AI-2E family transporter [Planctomycetota bacterium]
MSPTADDVASDEPALGKAADGSKRRYRRVLPPSLFLLVLVIVLVIFHGILLPFILALFFAYLVYPIVRALNSVHVRRLRVPRWTAVLITYFAVGFGLYHFIPLTLSGVTREFANLFKEIPGIFNGLKKQKEDLYQSIEARFRLDQLPPEQRAYIDAEFAHLWSTTHPASKADPQRAVDAGPGQAPEAAPAAGSARENARVPEWSESFTRFKQAFDRALEDTVAADDTYDRLIVGNLDPKTTVPTGQLKEIEQRVLSVVKDKRDRLGERWYGELEGDLRDIFQSAAEQARMVAEPAAGNDRPESMHALLARLYGEYLRDAEPSINPKQVDDLAKNIKDNLVPAFSREKLARDIREKLDDYFRSAQDGLIGQLERISAYVPSIIRGIFTFFVILMIAAFFIVFFPKIKAYGRDLFPPEFHEDYESILQKIDARLSGVIRGQFIICLVNGSLTYLGLWMLGLPLAPTLATIAGVLSLVPIFGTILSTIPAVIVALSVSSDHTSGGVLAQHIANNRLLLALAVIAWVCVIHAIESYILNPNIMGQTAHMNPLIIVFALLAGEHVGGIIGALLAVPIASIFVTLFAYLHKKTVASLSSGTPPQPQA